MDNDLAGNIRGQTANEPYRSWEDDAIRDRGWAKEYRLMGYEEMALKFEKMAAEKDAWAAKLL